MVKVTIKDVARRAGVSTATVSYVLNNTNRVGSETKERVLKAAEVLGYQPNAMAQGLVMRRTKTLGLVIPHTAEFVFSDPYFPTMLKGVSSVASRRGYYLLLSLPQEGENLLAACQGLYSQQRVDGVIMVCTPRQTKDWGIFESLQIPVVLLGDTHTADIASVDVDNETGSFRATMHLLEWGHTRIGCITGDMRYEYSDERLLGFERALSRFGLEPTAIVHGDFTRTSGKQGAERILSEHPEITALICGNDLMALGAMEALAERGKRIPRDISVIGFDDIPDAARAPVPLTTMGQPVEDLGRQAAELLLDLVEKKPVKNRQRLLKTELVVRASTGPMRRS